MTPLRMGFNLPELREALVAVSLKGSTHLDRFNNKEERLANLTRRMRMRPETPVDSLLSCCLR